MIYHGYELELHKSDLNEQMKRAARENQIQEIKASRRGNSSPWQRLVAFFGRSNLKSTYIPLHPSEKK